MDNLETATLTDGGENHVFINCEKGFLHGRLNKVPDSPGLVILVGDTHGLGASDRQLGLALRQAGLSVFELNLLTKVEAHYHDIHHNVPFLAKRLGLFIDSVKAQMEEGVLPYQPYGIYAANDVSPVAIRAAATHAECIAATVCLDGLIDLAGVEFLHAFAAPLLMLLQTFDDKRVATVRRALQELASEHELRCFLKLESEEDKSETPENPEIAQAAANWFLKHFEASRKIGAAKRC